MLPVCLVAIWHAKRILPVYALLVLDNANRFHITGVIIFFKDQLLHAVYAVKQGMCHVSGQKQEWKKSKALATVGCYQFINVPKWI